jgi:hypothetical protein
MVPPPIPQSDDFLELRLKAGTRAHFGLPDIGYPVPKHAFLEMMAGEGRLELERLLFWLQVRGQAGDSPWRMYAPAMARLSELLIPTPTSVSAGICGLGWELSVGAPDDPNKIVFIKREEVILAALSPTHEERLRIATYHPLDAKSIEMLLDLARDLHDGLTSMRNTQWDYTLDCAAGMGQHYACARAEAYLMGPENGADCFDKLRRLSLRSAAELGAELDTYEYFTREIAVDYG